MKSIGFFSRKGGGNNYTCVCEICCSHDNKDDRSFRSWSQHHIFFVCNLNFRSGWQPKLFCYSKVPQAFNVNLGGLFDLNIFNH